ncbi:MAG: ATP cone domain-containing protein, partial [Lachnospiraceae bacterium]|nr:ATP cone domain-containing protein [Lachnospiraceae bacterium]
MGLFLMNLKVKKRDGTIVPFDKEKISTAISKAYIEVCSTSFGKRHEQQINDVTEAVCDILQKTINTPVVDIEQIQDIVEQELMSVNK